ncbi:NADAR family protein [Phanerochaete sordida]|uniref:NADAR family protein n=1 Tax=Phanerochaete sordida TaxID=48140 RepID=A0A9P3LHW4_9APHY|nr:NADAR family protein [Phanerochaete sordida]
MSSASRWKFWKTNKKTPILFYERGRPYYEFTNFAAFPVYYEDRLYPTSEHLFQALKFIGHRPDLAERVRNAPSARQALTEATNNRRKQRNDWFHVNLNMMDRALHAKFTQHAALRDMLLGTGDRLLIENSPLDDFWGTGRNGRGQNELGKALMRLRNHLRYEAENNAVIPGVNAHVFSNQTRRRSQSRGEEKPLPTVPLQPHPDIVPQRRAASVEPQHGKRRRGARAPSAYQKLKGRFSSTPEVMEEPIYFYDRDQPYYEFTNFSPHEVWYDGKLYPTSEHLFQAQKFMQTAPDIAEHIRIQPSSKLALAEAQRLREHQRSDWFRVNRECMDLALEAKFTQHSSLHQLLLSTGDRGLVEASPVDPFWGYGKDMKGKNELGKALMRLRAQLRAVEDARRQEQVAPVGRGRSRSTVR